MATYYVKNAGSDAADGLSDDNAWETISKVNGETFAEGDTILFKRDHTWAEELIVPMAGLSFDAYGSGDKPIIDGDSGSNDTCITTTYDRTTIRNIVLTDSGVDNLYVNDADTIIIDGVDSTLATSGGSFTLHGSNIKMYASTASGSKYGISQVTPGCKDLLIDNCQVSACDTYGVYLVETLGVTFINSSVTGTISGRGLWLSGVNTANMHDLILTGNAGHGIDLDDSATVGCSSIQMDRITADDNTGCGVLVGTNASAVTLSRIHAEGNTVAGVKIEDGAATSVLSYSILADNPIGAHVTDDPLAGNAVYNCVFHENTTAGVALTGSTTAALTLVKNNIFIGNAIGVSADAAGIVPQTAGSVDYNLYFGSTTCAVRWSGTDYNDDELDDITTQETNGIGDQDPLLYSPPSDVHIHGSSPARGAGVVVAGIGPDYYNGSPHNPPSIGAAEVYIPWYPSAGRRR